MRNILKLCLATVMLFSLLETLSHAQTTPPPSVLFNNITNSVVTIRGENGSKSIQGSGVVFNTGVSQNAGVKYSYILTNAHVAADYKSVIVTTTSKTRYIADVVAYNRDIDLAVVRIDGVSLVEAKSRGYSSQHVSVGDRVYAIGSPRGLENSLSEGLVAGLRVYNGTQVLQTTAPISPGSSGGGLFDSDGNLIGITTFKFKDSDNLNFAVRLENIQLLELSEITTRASLEKAREASKADSGEAYLESRHQDWKDIVRSKEFDSWLRRKYPMDYDRINSSRDEKWIAQIIGEYKSYLELSKFDPSKIDCNRYVRKPLRETMHCTIRELRRRIAENEGSSSYAKQRFLSYDKWVLDRRTKLLEAYESGKISYEDAEAAYFKDLDSEESYLRNMR